MKIVLPVASLRHILNASGKDPAREFTRHAWIADLGDYGICLVATDGHRCHAARVARGAAKTPADSDLSETPPLGLCVEVEIARLRLKAARKSQCVELEVSADSKVLFPDLGPLFKNLPSAIHKVVAGVLNTLGATGERASVLVYAVSDVLYLGLHVTISGGAPVRLLQGPPPQAIKTPDPHGPAEDMCAVHPQYLADATEHLDYEVLAGQHHSQGLFLRALDGGLLAVVMGKRLPK